MYVVFKKATVASELDSSISIQTHAALYISSALHSIYQYQHYNGPLLSLRTSFIIACINTLSPPVIPPSSFSIISTVIDPSNGFKSASQKTSLSGNSPVWKYRRIPLAMQRDGDAPDVCCHHY